VAASDHLSPGQFMPMAKLLQLRSGDVHQDEQTVADVLPRKKAEMADPHMTPEYYAALRQSMVDHGQTAPIEVVRAPGGRVLGEGHHRVAIAHDLGWEGMHVRVTRSKYGRPASEYADPEFHQRYHWKEGNPG
jgi:hypothetical protein